MNSNVHHLSHHEDVWPSQQKSFSREHIKESLCSPCYVGWSRVYPYIIIYNPPSVSFFKNIGFNFTISCIINTIQLSTIRYTSYNDCLCQYSVTLNVKFVRQIWLITVKKSLFINK